MQWRDHTTLPSRGLGTAARRPEREVITDCLVNPETPCRGWIVCSVRSSLFWLVQWPSLRNFSDQLSRGRVKTCLLLFFGQILIRVLTAAMCELAASFVPFFEI